RAGPARRFALPRPGRQERAGGRPRAWDDVVTPYATLALVFATLIAGGLGFPIPEDVTLVGSGLLARSGSVALWQGIAVGIVGVCAGDWILYWAGRRYGASMLQHRWIARVVRPDQLATVRDVVQQRGALAVFLARFVLGTRIVTFLSAGAFGMAKLPFAV